MVKWQGRLCTVNICGCESRERRCCREGSVQKERDDESARRGFSVGGESVTEGRSDISRSRADLCWEVYRWTAGSFVSTFLDTVREYCCYCCC